MISIVQWLSEQSLSVDYINESNITMECPYCGKGEKHFQVCVDSNRPVFNCFHCQTKGSWVKLVADIGRMNYESAKEAVFGRMNLALVKKEQEADYLPRIPLPAHNLWTTRAREYLEQRNVNSKTIKEFGLYYCGSGRYSKRIIIPIRYKKENITFQARAILPDVAIKYISPPRSPISKLLFNYDNYFGDNVILVEGVFDVFRLWQKGWCAMATFGKKISPFQIALLEKRRPKKVFLMYDSDALSDMEDMWDRLQMRFDVRLVVLEDGDPADSESVEAALKVPLVSRSDLDRYKLSRFREKKLDISSKM